MDSFHATQRLCLVTGFALSCVQTGWADPPHGETGQTWFSKADHTTIPLERRSRRKWGNPVIADLDRDGYLDVLLTEHAKCARLFWNNAGVCCGSAGVASFFLSLHDLTGRPEYLDFARKMNRDTMSRATRIELEDGRIGLKWTHAEHRVQPDLLQAQTGCMQGAAGIGLWLLRLDAHQTGRPFGLSLPDSPF